MTKTSPRVLVVDDDEAMREVLGIRLKNWGYQVETAENGEQAGAVVEVQQPDIVLSDILMPGISGLELLKRLRAGNEERPVVLMTAHGTMEMAVEAVKEGAHDFLVKPVDYDKLKAILDEISGELESLETSRQLRDRLRRKNGFGAFVGSSKPMREVYSLIRAVAPSDASVLITGESGTGKELVARSIHDLSKRNEGPFVALNCAAIPKDLLESEVFGHEKGAFTGAHSVRAGCFETAHQGTLFLDEIAEMPSALQPKLLRVLEDGKVRRLGSNREFEFDVRLVAATNREPVKAIKEGALREDLYFRINVFHVELPPLRKRPTDLPLLVHDFVEKLNKKHDRKVEAVRPDAMDALQRYEWPGNVRELRNILERAVILARGKWIELSHLPPYVRQPGMGWGGEIVLPAGITAAEAEKELILKTLEKTGHNKAEAARQLGLDVKTIRNKLKGYGMS